MVEKVTGSPETALPFASTTTASTEVVAPGSTVDGASTTLTLAAGPAARMTLADAESPEMGSRTVIVARPVMVEAMRRIMTLPELSVVPELELRLPALVEKVSFSPEIGVPVVSKICAVSTAADEPSAVMLDWVDAKVRV